MTIFEICIGDKIIRLVTPLNEIRPNVLSYCLSGYKDFNVNRNNTGFSMQVKVRKRYRGGIFVA